MFSFLRRHYPPRCSVNFSDKDASCWPLFASRSSWPPLALFDLFDTAFSAAVGHVAARDGSTPSLPYDPNTSSSCVWWVDLSSPADCSLLVSESFINLEQFRKSTTTAQSTTTTTQRTTTTTAQSITTAVPPTTTSPTSTTTTSTTAATTTAPGNGMSTPVPTQTGMVGSCNKFQFVNMNQTCATIAALYSISVAQFIQWNPAA
ncbi:hypothetical protein C8A05DRAFT_20062 [Staphylotrichum tortipilum]|uniref:LysM domain-containing protein n=1 Tax=Staphylotrichum tortipilum TaxID=2831512 RepID=A0AAN6MA11_9PEZI|nr:hypothetical protein C8A05DRAFT_20062 [Staphylotrichum longicolle]